MGNQPLFDLRGQHSIRYFLRDGTRVSIKSKEEGKCQESIPLVSHLTQNTIWESDKRRKRHIQGRRRVFQMVRRRKPSSAEGTKG